MNIRELLDAVALRGITLEARGDRLRFRPRSAVTPEMLEQLKAHKPDLLAILEVEQEREAIQSEAEADADCLMREMLDRVNRACPADWRPTTAEWQMLDELEAAINEARERLDLAALRVALDDYETAALISSEERGGCTTPENG